MGAQPRSVQAGIVWNGRQLLIHQVIVIQFSVKTTEEILYYDQICEFSVILRSLVDSPQSPLKPEILKSKEIPYFLIRPVRCSVWQIMSKKTKQSSKFLSDPSPNCFTIDLWKINCWCQQFISYLSYCFFRSDFTAFYMYEFCSVLRCDILGIGLF